MNVFFSLLIFHNLSIHDDDDDDDVRKLSLITMKRLDMIWRRTISERGKGLELRSNKEKRRKKQKSEEKWSPRYRTKQRSFFEFFSCKCSGKWADGFFSKKKKSSPV